MVTQSRLENILTDIGFEFEGISPKEVEFKDIKNYSYYIY